MACGVGSTDIAIAFRFGKLWFRVPKTMRVQICGKFARGVYPKDAMLFLGGKIGAEGAAYKSIEFYGGAVDAMSVASRMTLANFSSEMGAKCAIVPADEKTGEFIKARGESSGFEAVAADADAEYESEHAIDTANLGPLLACPNDIDNVKAVEQVEGIPVDQVFIGSCTNGRAEDLRVARNILEGRRIPDATRLIVCPASQAVMDECIADGTMGSLVRAGATVFTPGCGPCLGRHGGALADGETCVSTSNRNFVGRMGSPKAQIYLASPATAAATARTGQITDPRKFI
jgi:homoaconitase/3-isopropylmalate dehydratase large subunit